MRNLSFPNPVPLLNEEKIIAVDADVVTCFVKAEQSDHARSLNPEGEKIYQIGLTYGFRVLPTVEEQLRAIPDVRNRLEHDESLRRLFLLVNLNYQEFIPRIEKRTLELFPHHNDKSDCRILAEAEAIDSSVLLTLDVNFQKHLRSRTSTPLLKPSQFDIPYGTRRKFQQIPPTQN